MNELAFDYMDVDLVPLPSALWLLSTASSAWLDWREERQRADKAIAMEAFEGNPSFQTIDSEAVSAMCGQR